jgi:hypothetical protein
VYYELRARVTAERSRALVSQLHAAARELPFDQMTGVREFTVSAPGRRHTDAKPAVALAATRSVEYVTTGGERKTLFVPPEHCSFFTVRVAGAESASVGLASYAAHVMTEEENGRRVPTGLDGCYSWHSWCKTQYAALPACGGTPNFLRAHLSLIHLLDRARLLGIEVEVRDDGGYFESRNEQRLLAELESSNRAVAALAGHIKDALSRFFHVEVVEAPITRHPAFERLEAEGQRDQERPP